MPVLQVARVLMNAERWQEAREILERLKPRDKEERIERLFLLGSAEARLGLLPEAAERFEAILAVRPELTRVRLELARVYHLLGRDEKARFHFEASLGDELPSSVEGAVEAYLNRIDARKHWSVSLSLAALPESNPVKRTDREEVRIGGVPFRLNEDAREASGTGLLLSTGVQYSPVLTGSWRGVLAASAAAKFYEQSDWNDISAQGDLGAARLFDRGSASGGLRLGRRWLGGDHFSTGAGPWARGRLRLSPALRLDGALSAERRDHPGNPGLDGWTVNLRPGLDYALSSATTLRAELDLEHVSADEERLGNRMGGLALALSHAFQGGLSVSPRIAVHWRRYGDKDPLFQETRSDRQARVSVNLLHRALQVRGFAPYIGYFYEWNRSNIPINAYRNHGMVLGISRSF
ncbi:MAG: surface lipoprotein assembly modifier [Alphaproteobacteria bacterium]|nr:surface lipoprotein assembly modifier [Alphaproteobacteria bacterium]